MCGLDSAASASASDVSNTSYPAAASWAATRSPSRLRDGQRSRRRQTKDPCSRPCPPLQRIPTVQQSAALAPACIRGDGRAAAGKPCGRGRSPRGMTCDAPTAPC